MAEFKPDGFLQPAEEVFSGLCFFAADAFAFLVADAAEEEAGEDI